MMRVLINDDELVEALARRMIVRRIRSLQPTFSGFDTYCRKIKKQKIKTRELNLDFNVVRELVIKDLTEWRNHINRIYKNQYRLLIRWLSDNIDRTGFTRSELLQLMKIDQHTTMTSRVAESLEDTIQLVTLDQSTAAGPTIVIRNIKHNQQVLKDLMESQQSFWFIDSGYTNFLDGRKRWHRLVNDHIHHRIPANQSFPADRLEMLPSFPRPWNTNGQDILVVESSEEHYQMFGMSNKSWKRQLTTELSSYTNRQIVFKPKDKSRKTRTSVYELLQQEPNRWYCVISESSVAAVEAIWMGVPVITLGRHITNAVSRSKLSDINDLYRGSVGDWLCALTYSQFTVKEMTDGTAAKILSEFYHV